MTETSALSEAVRLFKEGQAESSRQLLRDSLRSNPKLIDILLWLARVSTDTREALAAAELALSLEPDNEIAQRAVAAVQNRFPETSSSQEPIEIMRVTGMTQSQARAVIWPFRGLNRPMGVLFDDGKITTKDLNYAIENAEGSNLQRAARTLLLTRLLGDKLKVPPPPLTVVEGSDYTGYRERFSHTLSGLFLGIELSVLVFCIVALLLVGVMSRMELLILAFVFLVLSYLSEKLQERFESEANQFKVGREGEQRVIDALRASLNSPWVLVHNLEWPDRHWGDVDLVLIGTGGIWAIEVKAFTFATRNRGDYWECRGRWGWHQLSKHPGEQAQRNAVNVREYLKSKGLFVRWVESVVVWAGEENLLHVQDPTVPIWKLSEIPERIEELWREQRLSDDQIQQCADVLKQVVAQMQQKISGNRKK